jgi:hypothetical protein
MLAQYKTDRQAAAYWAGLKTLSVSGRARLLSGAAHIRDIMELSPEI